MPDLFRTALPFTGRHGGRSTRFIVAATLSLGAALVAAPVAVASGERPDVEAVDEGEVIIATPNGEPATNGGSATPFRLLLPDGASCPGDSASDNWLVQTFLIPAGDDPGEIRYGFSGPEGTQYPLYALDTTPVAHQVTQIARTPGGEGVINLLPDFSFAVFPPGYIPAGDYTIGVACEYYRDTARYWDAPIVIEANADDEPAGLTWRLPSEDSFDPPPKTSPAWYVIFAVAGVGIVAAIVTRIVRRRRPPNPPTPSDRSDRRPLTRTSS